MSVIEPKVDDPAAEPASAPGPRTKRGLRPRRRRLGPDGQPRDASIPLRRLIPNMFTAAAMCCGLASIYFATKAQPDFARAVAAIGMAMVLDAMDGRLARLLKATSRFGETFDSLSDFVSFGVAPVVLLYKWVMHADVAAVPIITSPGAAAAAGSTAAAPLTTGATFGGVNLEGLVLLAGIIYAVCAAYRLDRFNREQRAKKPGVKPAEFFTGCPSPAAAAAVLIPAMLWLSETVATKVPVIVVIAHMLLVGALMASRTPMFSFKRLRVPRRAVGPLMIFAAGVVAAATQDAWLTAAALASLYLCSLPVAALLAQRRAALGLTAPGPDQPADLHDHDDHVAPGPAANPAGLNAPR